MQLSVNGIDTFVANGGREFDTSQPTIVLLHGAGFDHTIWALHSRWFAHHGFGVLAPDLPGHGRSSGTALGKNLRARPDRNGGDHDGRARSAQGCGSQRSDRHRYGRDLGSWFSG